MKRLVLMILAFSITFFGCGEERTQPAAPLRIGLVTWIGYGPLYVAQEKGYFKEQNVQVDLQRIEGDVERRAATAVGEADRTSITPDAPSALLTPSLPR